MIGPIVKIDNTKTQAYIESDRAAQDRSTEYLKAYTVRDCINSAAAQGQELVDQCADAFDRDRFAYSGEFIDFMTSFSTNNSYKRYWDIPLGSAPLPLIEAVKIHRTALRAHEHQAAQQS